MSLVTITLKDNIYTPDEVDLSAAEDLIEFVSQLSAGMFCKALTKSLQEGEMTPEECDHVAQLFCEKGLDPAMSYLQEKHPELLVEKSETE